MDRDAYAKMAAAFLDEIDNAVQASGKADEFTCGPGCAHCCRLPVDASYPEGALAAGYVRYALSYEMEAVRSRLESWAQWSRTELVDMLADGMDPVRAYLYHGPGCPFLHGGMCIIYPARPAGCRVHNSIKDPTECCPAEDELPVFFTSGSVREVNEAVRPVIAAYMLRLKSAALDASRPVEPLPLMVLSEL